MSRRGENIRKRKDGRWEGRYTFFDAVSGKSKTRSVYAKTYGEVKEKLATAKHDMQSIRSSGDMIAHHITFGEAAEEWFQSIEKTKKYSTYIKYSSIYRKYLGGKMGGLLIVGLVEEGIRDILEEEVRQRRETLSDSVRRSIYCVLNQILEYANIHYKTSVPRVLFRKQHGSGKNIEVLNHTEQAALFQFLYKDTNLDKLGILMCISTGLRLGEICSLKWEDVDLREKVLHVNSTVQRIAVDGMETRTALLEGKPKSVFSEREIPISEELARLITPFHMKSGYVLNGSRPMEPRTYQKRFQRYLTLAGVEKKNFHILRHTFATNCIDNGTDIKSLSEILGHSDVKITLNRYVHPTIEMKRQHLNALSAIYGQYLGQEAAEK